MYRVIICYEDCLLLRYIMCYEACLLFRYIMCYDDRLLRVGASGPGEIREDSTTVNPDEPVSRTRYSCSVICGEKLQE